MSGVCCHPSLPLPPGVYGCEDRENAEQICAIIGGFWDPTADDCDWYDCVAHAELGACCTTWGCINRIGQVRCLELGGEYYRKVVCNVLLCPEQEPEPGCYQARPDRPSGVQLGWTDDLCATVEFQPGRFVDESGPYFQLFSTRPTRALGVIIEEEPCRYQVTDMFLDEWGYAAPVLCNNPFPGLPVSQNRVGELHCMVGDGEAGLFGAYHTPYWTEAILRSSALRCCGVYQ